MSRVCLILFILLNSLIIRGQDTYVKAWFDTTRIFIGDQINFNIEIDHPEGSDILYPVFNDSLTSGVEIIESFGPDTLSLNNSGITVRISHLITCFDTGYYEIDPVFVESRNERGVTREYSDYNLLEVIRVDIAPSDSTALIFDIDGPRKARLTFMEILPWLMLALLLIVVTYLIVRYIRGRQKKEVVDESFLPSEPFHIIALRELDKLDRKELWQKGKHKLYYSDLTEILRTYIDRRFSISCMEMTTSETLNSLIGSGFKQDDLYMNLSEILRTADLSKFAKFRPSEDTNLNSISDAREFVRRTSVTENGVTMIDESKERKEEVDE